jgi:hypothetical protein
MVWRRRVERWVPVPGDVIRHLLRSATLRSRLLPFVFFLSVTASYAWFYNGSGDNQLSRLDPVFSFVEPGSGDYRSFRIDHFVVREDFNTGDWSRAGGHYYSNKAPGSTWLAIPVYEVLFRAERALGVDPSTLSLTSVNSYLIGVAITAIPVAIAATLFLAFLLNRGWRRSDALIVASLFAYGSLLFPFATQLWGHPTAAALLMIALVMTLRPAPSHFAAGLLCASAMVVDHLAIASLGLFFVYAIVRGSRSAALRFAAGAALPLAALALYDATLFGSPLRSAPSMQNPLYVDPTRFAGAFGRPSLDVMAKLLVSPERGVLLYMPILLFAIAGVFTAARERRETLFLAANAVAYFVLNSMFNGWHGGWSTGPRYLILAFPFCFALMWPPSSLRPALRVTFAATALLTVTNMLAIAAVTPMTSVDRNPLYGATYRDLFAGNLQPCDNIVVRLQAINLPADRHLACFNLGSRILHARGAWTLLPLLVLMALPFCIRDRLAGRAAGLLRQVHHVRR